MVGGIMGGTEDGAGEALDGVCRIMAIHTPTIRTDPMPRITRIVMHLTRTVTHRIILTVMRRTIAVPAIARCESTSATDQSCGAFGCASATAERAFRTVPLPPKVGWTSHDVCCWIENQQSDGDC